MKITSRFAAKVVGVFLAAFVVMGLAACAPSSARINEEFLVVANVQAVDCQEAEDPEALAKELQATAVFVAEASPKQESDVLKRNPELESTGPLIAALEDAFEACGGVTGDSEDAPEEEVSDEDETIVLSPELKALLDVANVPLDEFVCTKIVGDTGGKVVDGTYTLFVNTLLKVDEGNLDLRQWSDALSNTLKGSTPEEARSWLNRAICEEPAIGIPLAHLFAKLKVNGISVLSLQSTDWLEFANVDASEINDLVAKFVPLTVWKLENPSKQDIPDEVYVAALEANHEYQEIAFRLLRLLSNYQLAPQIMSIGSTHHYHLVAGGLTADGIPEIGVSNEVDNRPALVFYLTEKTACKPISVLAFNMGDKRPMLGAVPDSCEVFVPPVVTPPPGGGDCVTNCVPQDCPPGQVRNENGVCATPKSSDPTQWIYPEDKPKVGAPEGDPGAPAEVITEQGGGGGVVDVVTNDPNSETGVGTEGTGGTGTDVRDTGENQGGDNGAGDGGGF